jgi:hypothetical protein
MYHLFGKRGSYIVQVQGKVTYLKYHWILLQRNVETVLRADCATSFGSGSASIQTGADLITHFPIETNSNAYKYNSCQKQVY